MSSHSNAVRARIAPMNRLTARVARVRGLPRAAYAAVLAIFGATVALLLTVLVLTQAMGWHFVIVSGSSMEPTIRYGSVALMRPAQGADVGPGDIVEFTAPGTGKVTTHRIVEVAEGGQSFVTRGDNSPSIDQAPVPFAAIKGEHVLSVPFAGRVIWWLRTPLGFLSFIIVPGIVIAASEAWSTIRGYRDRPAAEPEAEGTNESQA